MRKKKMLSLALAGILSATALFGCGGAANETPAATPAASGSEATTEASADENPYAEHMEISIGTWSIADALDDTANDALYQYICDKFNIEIVPQNTTWDDYTQKIQMWAASGSMPDIVSIDIVGTPMYYQWTEQGVVRPLLDMSKYPNLKDYFETEDIAAMADANGNYYAVPRRMFPSTDWSALDRVVAYRWDLAQEAGVTKEPETWDEFIDMLDKIVKADPENQNVTGVTASQTKMIGGLFWLYSNPVATSDGSGSDFKWIKEDGKYIPAVFSKNSLASLQNMRDMYTAGLVDPDLANTNVNLAYDKFIAGQCCAVLMGGGYKNVDGALYQQRWKDLYPDKDFNECVKVLKPLKNANGDLAHAIFKTYWSETYFSADVDDAKMDRIMALYDWLLSEEGINTVVYGFEGEDYKANGSDIEVITEDLSGKYHSRALFFDLVAYNDYRAYDMSSPTIVSKEIRQEAVDYISWVLDNTKLPKYYPALTMLSTDTKREFTVLDHDDMMNIMMGKEPVEDMWNKIVSEYEAKGLSQMIDEVNAAAASMNLD